MPFLAPVIPLIAAAIGGGAAVYGAKKASSTAKDINTSTQAQMNPLIDIQKKIATSASTSGLANTAAARGNFDFVNEYLKKILTGSDSELLKTLDAAGATRNADENEQLASELSVRGGNRAAKLGQANFDRSASIDNILKQLRFAAPGQLASIAQAIGNLGVGELSTAVGAGGQASNSIFNTARLEDADADRRAQMIASIFETLGTFGGIIAAKKGGGTSSTSGGVIGTGG